MFSKRKAKAISILSVLGIMVCGGLSGCGNKSNSSKLDTEINVFNWSEYIPQAVIDKFEKKYGIKVNYTNYASNEEMLSKVMAGKGQYDIAVPTDYMVDIMKKQNLLEKINLKNVPNFKNIGAEYKNKYFDPQNQYSIPFMTGDIVIAVNTKEVKVPVTSYADLWNSSFKDSIVVLDDERGIIGMALKKLGYSLNETDPKKLEEAKQELLKLKTNIKSFDSDSPKNSLINGEATLGVVWGAEAALAERENPDIKTVLPKEGMYLNQDNFVIPKDAPHKRTAELFINFILDPKISAQISKKYPYGNPNTAALKYIDKKILSDIAVYPPAADRKKGEYIKDIGKKISDFDKIWSEIKK